VHNGQVWREISHASAAEDHRSTATATDRLHRSESSTAALQNRQSRVAAASQAVTHIIPHNSSCSTSLQYGCIIQPCPIRTAAQVGSSLHDKTQSICQIMQATWQSASHAANTQSTFITATSSNQPPHAQQHRWAVHIMINHNACAKSYRQPGNLLYGQPGAVCLSNCIDRIAAQAAHERPKISTCTSTNAQMAFLARLRLPCSTPNNHNQKLLYAAVAQAP
jgi:hypothetical protein